MDTLFGKPVVVDDQLFARARAEGFDFEDEADAFGWLADDYQDGGTWPHCGCRPRCSECLDHGFIRSTEGGIALQLVDHRTGKPWPPEWRRLKDEAREFGIDHAWATPWLIHWYLHRPRRHTPA